MDLIELTTKNIEIEKYYLKTMAEYTGAIFVSLGLSDRAKIKKSVTFFMKLNSVGKEKFRKN